MNTSSATQVFIDFLFDVSKQNNLDKKNQQIKNDNDHHPAPPLPHPPKNYIKKTFDSSIVYKGHVYGVAGSIVVFGGMPLGEQGCRRKQYQVKFSANEKDSSYT